MEGWTRDYWGSEWKKGIFEKNRGEKVDKGTSDAPSRVSLEAGNKPGKSEERDKVHLTKIGRRMLRPRKNPIGKSIATIEQIGVIKTGRIFANPHQYDQNSGSSTEKGGTGSDGRRLSLLRGQTGKRISTECCTNSS